MSLANTTPDILQPQGWLVYTPQNAVFNNLDLVLELVEHLYPGSLSSLELPSIQRDRRIRQQTLARLAQVSGVFSKPALDVLWRSLDDVRHLLRILPIFEEVLRDDGKSHYWRFRWGSYSLGEGDWQRFRTYAGRVHQLCTPAMRDIEVFVQFMREIPRWNSRDPQQRYLLPRLEVLDQLDIRGFGGTYHYISSNLRMLTLNIDFEAWGRSIGCEEAITVLERVRLQNEVPTGLYRTLKPMLDRLEVLQLEQVNGWLNDKPDPECIPFWTMSHLYTLKVYHKVDLSAARLQAIMDFPHLRKLVLSITATSIDDGHKFHPGFNGLDYLAIMGSMEDVSRFLSWSSPPNLKNIWIGADLTGTAEPQEVPLCVEKHNRLLRQIFDMLKPSIRKIGLELVLPEDNTCYTGPPVSQLLDLVQGSAVGNLLELRFDFKRFSVRSTLSDSDIRRLCEPKVLWPDLTLFELNFLTGTSEIRLNDPATAMPTLQTVGMFARTHPHLERLNVPAIAVNFNPHPAFAMGGRDGSLRNHGLQLLRVSALPPTRLGLSRFAAELDKMFPRLDLVDVERLTTNKTGDRQVVDVLGRKLLKLQKARGVA